MNLLTCTRDEFNKMANELVRRGIGWRLCHRDDIFGRTVNWLESSSILKRNRVDSFTEELLVNFFISYNECYSQPQLHFFPEHSLNSEELSLWMCGVCVGSVENQDYNSPIVSMTFSEELEMALWGLHQCDTTQLLQNILDKEAKGNLLELFLQCVSQFVGMDRLLIPIPL